MSEFPHSFWDEMNYTITQTDIANPETQYFDSNRLNPLVYLIKILPSSDSSSSQLKNKINHNFGTTGHRLKIQKAKLVRIKFPIELSNFTWQNVFCIKFFYQLS